MTATQVVAALELPAAARVDQRVPKSLLLEHGATTAADKRLIQDGVEEIRWLAALKPTTVGVPAYRDDNREYLEVAILSTKFRSGAKASRLAELIHRAVPYPVLLVATVGERVAVSLAHKRWSQGEVGATVLDGELVLANIGDAPQMATMAFAAALPLSRQPNLHLRALYQGWMDTTVALLAASVTGAFIVLETPERAAARLEALRACARLDVEMARLRSAAAKEKQLARQVELNLKLKSLQRERAEAQARM